jgi:branched-chain amino acid aminotransferase
VTRAWLNGQLVDAALPALTVDDPGFLVGDGVFTTTRVVDGVPYALERNLRRLLTSLQRVGLPVPVAADLRAGVAELLASDAVRQGRLRITVSAASCAITHHPVLPQPASAAVVVLPWRRNEHGALTGVKSTSFGENLVGQRRVRALGADEGLLGNTAGQVCEGLTSNVFMVLDGTLRTPPLSAGCLPGITRELLCEVLEVDQGDLPLSVLGRVEEAFLTSATRGVQPIHSLDGRPLPAPGPLTARAARALAELDR